MKPYQSGQSARLELIHGPSARVSYSPLAPFKLMFQAGTLSAQEVRYLFSLLKRIFNFLHLNRATLATLDFRVVSQTRCVSQQFLFARFDELATRTWLTRSSEITFYGPILIHLLHGVRQRAFISTRVISFDKRSQERRKQTVAQWEQMKTYCSKRYRP